MDALSLLPRPLSAQAPSAVPDGSQGRRILIVDFDMFHSIGGGQSVYRRLIALRPQDTWYYFRRHEAPDAERPSNAIAIAFAQHVRAPAEAVPPGLEAFLGTYVLARNMALSAAVQCGALTFDVLDVPDYTQVGIFLKHALLSEGIGVGRVAVALHGTISSAFRGGWPTGGDDRHMLARERLRESLQFRAADTRYAISDRYATEWSQRTGMAINHLDPLCITGASDPAPARTGAGAPDLAFIGRREKWKGPDLFLDLAWCIDRAAYGRLMLIGPEGPNRHGDGSVETLAAMARRRALGFEMIGRMERDRVQDLLRARTALLLPSRSDTFNLTALEAIQLGCPTLVSRAAGVAAWLQRALPDLDWLLIDVDCSRDAARQVQDTLRQYDRRRDALCEALHRRRLAPDMASADRIYDGDGETDMQARRRLGELAARLDTLIVLRRGSGARGHARRMARLAAGLPGAGVLREPALAVRQWRRHGPRRLIQGFVYRFAPQISGYAPATLRQIHGARTIARARRYYLRAPERSYVDRTAKLRKIAARVPSRYADRVTLFREMARLERRHDPHSLIAATYALRLMRWLGDDAYGDVAHVAATLRRHGYDHEADAAEAMFCAQPDRQERCAALLQDAVARNRHLPDRPLAVCDDRRAAEPAPRVSVIVSLYDAAGKLPVLLRMLASQTIAAMGQLEVVLVDSGSPGDERGAFEAFAAGHALPIVYARSARRETIQAAWNRGIRLSRAPYLAFLGADEGLHPDALRRLAAELDGRPEVDWAMADSLVTSVDRGGVYDADVMTYDRRGFHQDLVYLETCYLSWVGGLYRRSIHDRLGCYDESFRAAGDTEFKNRVLPHIRCSHVPGLLGVFNNYPEARTTASPRAEIEDLRAWYLWRTPAGMEYAFGRRPAADAVDLLRHCLSYRKSFCGHRSTDFDLAHSLVRHLGARRDAPPWITDAAPAIDAVLHLLREVDHPAPGIADGVGGARGAYRLYRQVRALQRMAPHHQALFGLPALPHYEVFNDNRYEQHWWSWSKS